MMTYCHFEALQFIDCASNDDTAEGRVDCSGYVLELRAFSLVRNYRLDDGNDDATNQPSSSFCCIIEQQTVE